MLLPLQRRKQRLYVRIRFRNACYLAFVAACFLHNVNATMNPFPRFDGWYNNLMNIRWGSPGGSMVRKVPAKYSDGVYQPYGTENGLPNSRDVSEILAEVGDVEEIAPSSGRTVFLTFFAQHVVDEIVDTRRVSCPAEYMNIQVRNTSEVNEKIMPVYRAKYNKKTGSSVNSPRTMVNEATSWLDGSAIYGPSQSWSDHLRDFKDGRLKTGNSSDFPPFNTIGLPLINPTLDSSRHPDKRNPGELLGFGNPRGNENVFLMTMGIIWFRYHNVLAQRLAEENPDWPDQKIFENARRWTVATYQNVAFYEMLQYLVDNFTMPEYLGYNQLLEPGISLEFSVAAMRIGHSMVPAGVALRRSNCSVVDPLPEEYGGSAGEPTLRLCNTYWQLQDAVVKHGIDDIVRGLVSQPSPNAGHVMTDDLRNFLYGPMKRTRMDLLALTVERGRDAGVARYNSLREKFRLPKVRSFSEFTAISPDVLDRLSEIYGNDTDRLDLYVGGLLEAIGSPGGVGDLFSQIIVEQFARLRDSDRFWFENRELGFFTADDIARIRNTTTKDVILATTAIGGGEIQDNVFLTTGSVCPSVSVTTANFSQPCTPNMGRNFFDGYWEKYVQVIFLLILFPILALITMRGIAWNNRHKSKAEKVRLQKSLSKRASQLILSSPDRGHMAENVFTALEIEGKSKTQPVVVLLEDKLIKILNATGRVLRSVNLERFKRAVMMLSRNKRADLMVIRVPKEYDIVLRFVGYEERSAARSAVETFFTQIEVNLRVIEMYEKVLLREAVTKEARQELLESFFRRVFAELLHIEPDEMASMVQQNELSRVGGETDRDLNQELIDCELTEEELAETMGLTSGSMFVKQMFAMADTDHSGYLSMREFADLIVLLMNGTPEQKAKLLFDMYDVDKSGAISREEGEAMIKSFLDLASYSSKGIDVNEAIDAIFRESGVDHDGSLTLEAFTHALLKDHREALASAKLDLPKVPHTKHGRRKSSKGIIFPESLNVAEARHRSSTSSNENTQESPPRSLKSARRSTMRIFQPMLESGAAANKEAKQAWKRWVKSVVRYVENYRRHIMCIVIFYSITLAVMVERATHYALKSEHKGIRQVTEWGLITSRATAAAISFHFSIILLTMCRNLITFCRETFLGGFIPFDAAVAFHKQIAYVAIVETAFHVMGHLVNFYHLSVHPLPVLACVFPKLLVDDGSDMPMSFIWWLFQTVTGCTGVLLVAVLSVIYVFASQYSRRYCFRAFWMTHHLFVLMFILVILHGSVGLIQSPLFHFYFSGPALIFTVDQLITISRSKIDISVVRAEPLPSGVLNLVFKRPTAFDYKSGQWVKIACTSLGTSEYHPFTLTSAPHEENLSLHIRAVGPWTTNLRALYQTAIDEKSPYPKIYLDGPFGEGHQDWYKYEVSVLVGAGIGVTPFASILKDIVFKNQAAGGLRVACKKVYFIWVTRTQRHFEWLTDIIRELEDSDSGNMVDTHIYITQFHHKFDLRTTMLYICEGFFQKEANKSLFTGLKAKTHFGRPQFTPFLDSLQLIHPEVHNFGVFSCGPPGLTNGVESSCKTINKQSKAQFIHFFENF